MPKRSRKGHPERTGDQQYVREHLFDLFEMIDKSGHNYLWDELFDTLSDEAMARGLGSWLELSFLGYGRPRHGGQS